MQPNQNTLACANKEPGFKQQIKLNKSLFIDFNKQNINQFYEIHGLLGEGGFGKVYQASSKTKPNCTRAIKVIEKQKLKKNKAIENQIHILIKADHPSIIKIFETFEDQQFYYIVMEICNGGELFYYLCEHQQLSENTIRIIFMQMAEAIQYCHCNKIAHRDIKPENFLILSKQAPLQENQLKLIDFGFAYQWKVDMKAQIKKQAFKESLGTPYYVAPEVLFKQGYDERCDVWSLGVILYILVTGTLPFKGTTNKEILETVKKGYYETDIPQFKRVSFILKDLIERLLQPVEKRILLSEVFNHPWINLSQLPTNSIKLNFGKLYSFSKYSKLKQIAITYIAAQMSESEIHNLSELFRSIDSNHDGQLSLQQFKDCLKSQNHKISIKQIENLISQIDLDKDGVITYTEFVSSCLENLKIFKKQNILSAFRMLDRDNDGKVSVEELRLFFSKNHELNSQMKQNQIQKIIKASDNNHDGTIDLEQFEKALTSRI